MPDPQTSKLRHIRKMLSALSLAWDTVVSRIVTFPDGYFPGKTFLGKTFPDGFFSGRDVSRKDDSRIVTFPEIWLLNG